MIHTLKNIKYDLVKMEKALVFQILEQERSWTNRKSNPIYNYKKFISEKNQVYICTFQSPELKRYPFDGDSDFRIELRGHNSCLDHKPVSEFFHSNEKRDIFYTKIVESLEEWNGYVEGLKKFINK